MMLSIFENEIAEGACMYKNDDPLKWCCSCYENKTKIIILGQVTGIEKAMIPVAAVFEGNMENHLLGVLLCTSMLLLSVSYCNVSFLFFSFLFFSFFLF